MIIRIIDDNELLDTSVLSEIEEKLHMMASVVNDMSFTHCLPMKALEDAFAVLSLVDEDEIHELNREYRDKDQSTDVLSFPMINMKNGNLLDSVDDLDFEYSVDGKPELNLGDIIICPAVASIQAENLNHSLAREIVFLVCHSLLHLFGFDHVDNPEDERLMIDLQRVIMSKIYTDEFNDNDYIFDSHNDKAEDSITSLNEQLLNNNIVYPAGSICEHVGYVAILGRPNVGKSTLINYLSGMKLAIVSHKPQTTRNNIRFIYNDDDTQIIFVDTPGVHKPKSKLSEIMVENSFNSAKHADVVLLIADGRYTSPAQVERELINLCRENSKKVILAINKTDSIVKETLLPAIANYSSLYDFEEIIPISAETGDNVDVLINKLKSLLGQGPRLFDSEEMTDQTEREIACELIREQLLHYTNQEIPHGTAVEITEFKEKYKDDAVDDYDRDMVVISASIVCEKRSHKGIILGKNGEMIKRIGTKSRIAIERLCGCKVYLDLFVKVREDWKNDDTFLNSFGYKAEEDN
ncbi:MAG: GTPase Era [Clostridia bacterium]|nr:GTPase Era [Clostridia bacterium]